VKKIINLFGGPGIGKSTTAALLYAISKQRHINAELVREYIKNWIWEGRKIQDGDQIYIAAKQSRLERICFKDADLIVTDSPLMLGEFYEKKHDVNYPVVEHIIKKQEEIAKSMGWSYTNVLLHRSDNPYNPIGRIHSEQEAHECDKEILQMLEDKGVEITHVSVGPKVAETILESIIGTNNESI